MNVESFASCEVSPKVQGGHCLQDTSPGHVYCKYGTQLPPAQEDPEAGEQVKMLNQESYDCLINDRCLPSGSTCVSKGQMERYYIIDGIHEPRCLPWTCAPCEPGVRRGHERGSSSFPRTLSVLCGWAPPATWYDALISVSSTRWRDYVISPPHALCIQKAGRVAGRQIRASSHAEKHDWPTQTYDRLQEQG